MTGSAGYLYYFFNRGIRHLASVYRWVVLIKPLAPEAAIDQLTTEAGETFLLRQADTTDYPALVDAYPVEFSRHLPAAIKRRELLSRASRGVPCFVVVSPEGRICGATWCPSRGETVLKQASIEAEGRVFEMVNTFVVPELRGHGLGSALRRFALNEMARQGFSAVISYVWYSRQESLAMNFATGSRLLAEKRQFTFLGRRKVTFHHRMSLPALPLPEKPDVIVLGQHSSTSREVAKVFRKWGVTAKAPGIKRFLKTVPAYNSLPPLIFCCDSNSAALFDSESLSQRFMARLLPTRWSDLSEREKGLFGQRSWSADPERPIADDLVALESDAIGMAGFLYLKGINRGDLIRLWRPTGPCPKE